MPFLKHLIRGDHWLTDYLHPDTINKISKEVLEFNGDSIVGHLQRSIGAFLKKILSKYSCSSTTNN